MLKKILINGAFGRMGQLACSTLDNSSEFLLIAKTGRDHDLDAEIDQHQPDIVIDFTHAHCVWENVQKILKYPVYPIIGTSGLEKKQIMHIIDASKTKKQGGLIVPNFSIGAVLQMRCAEWVARYFRRIEIIEIHHEKKLDAPSGTAIRTAERIQETNACQATIHSIRLPGFVAQQEVLFGAAAETLSITHSVTSRDAYMPGLMLACKKVTGFEQIYYGLESCLEE